MSVTDCKGSDFHDWNKVSMEEIFNLCKQNEPYQLPSWNQVPGPQGVTGCREGACDLAICLLFENLSLVVTMATSKVTVGHTGIMSCLNFL